MLTLFQENTILETNISLPKVCLKMVVLLRRWDMFSRSRVRVATKHQWSKRSHNWKWERKGHFTEMPVDAGCTNFSGSISSKFGFWMVRIPTDLKVNLPKSYYRKFAAFHESMVRNPHIFGVVLRDYDPNGWDPT